MHKILVFLFLGLYTVAKEQSYKEKLNPLMDSLKARYANYGVSIGIVDHDSTYFLSWGNTASNQGPIDQFTEFEVGSLTKTFTGLLLGIAVEKRWIGKGDPIDRYLPRGFILKPNIRHIVKVTDLASHQSGLPNFNDDEYIMNLFKANLEQPFQAVDSQFLYKVLGQTDSLAGHGTYRYSNFGFALLGQVLQQATKTSYETLLKREIILPMRLNSTSLTHTPSLHQASLFDEDGNKKQPLSITVMKPAGGLLSNADNMVVFLKKQIFPGNDILGKAIKLTHQPIYSDSSLSVGFGWEMQDGYIQKTGDTWGNSSILRIDPIAKTGVVILSDHHNSQLVQDIATALFTILKK